MALLQNLSHIFVRKLS